MMIYRDHKKAFEDAINTGRLNLDEDSDLYAGKWMYMFTNEQGIDQFKNNDTRNYLVLYEARREYWRT
tara:strand:- start:1303 stop:1506 length:204 start_codon:yes stop_codon:yes gene_type:complete